MQPLSRPPTGRAVGVVFPLSGPVHLSHFTPTARRFWVPAFRAVAWGNYSSMLSALVIRVVVLVVFASLSSHVKRIPKTLVSLHVFACRVSGRACTAVCVPPRHSVTQPGYRPSLPPSMPPTQSSPRAFHSRICGTTSPPAHTQSLAKPHPPSA